MKYLIIAATLLPVVAFAQTPATSPQPIDYARGLASLLQASQSREIESAAALAAANVKIKTLEDENTALKAKPADTKK